jgi:hypothetical protein
MQRRHLLGGLAAGVALPAAGCLSLGEPTAPLQFAVVNRRQRSYAVEFTLRHAGEVVLDGAADIAPRPPDEEYTALRFDDLAQLANGDEIDARVRVGGETFDHTYEVSCSRSETAENDLFFDIPHPDASTSMGFRGSEC